MENAERLLGTRVVPISAQAGDGILDDLIPEILNAALGCRCCNGASAPGVRAMITNRIIQNAAWTNALISLEPIPGLDIPLLLASQTRLVLRIAAAYGHVFDRLARA